MLPRRLRISPVRRYAPREMHGGLSLPMDGSVRFLGDLPDEVMNRIAIALSMLYIAGVSTLIALTPEAIASLKLNELGDLIAGFASPLALLWLITGYRLQSQELRLQRRELEANTQANKDQAEQLASQAHSFAEQLALLKEDRVERSLEQRQQRIPVLKLTHIRTIEEGHLHEFRLRNGGGDAIRLALVQVSSGWAVARSFDETALPTGGAIDVLFATLHGGPSPATLTFEIRYEDRTATQYFSAFDVRDGNVVKISSRLQPEWTGSQITGVPQH